ncbi:hypothetical protein RFI_03049 [Reticulomyxa filosa]|uniref:Uncharacterized protein n=1 Tax=Reticulomyxa filosa TaxID=46433 RepID=X6P7F0_RETFI|nr:hypothetical protein RFI_03049 [Reticulomyxa filosa]|eukprot:ETO34048.1 hypothetical protein RFI_03049 [Reticulomyxa filosa]
MRLSSRDSVLHKTASLLYNPHHNGCILLTGANGYVGHYLLNYLLHHTSHFIVALYHHHQPYVFDEFDIDLDYSNDEKQGDTDYNTKTSSGTSTSGSSPARIFTTNNFSQQFSSPKLRGMGKFTLSKPKSKTKAQANTERKNFDSMRVQMLSIDLANDNSVKECLKYVVLIFHCSFF